MTPLKQSWIVIKNDHRAKTAGEIKVPKTVNENSVDAIREDQTIGQIYDYMMSQKHFYNQKYVFGILTTLDEWKFCWLPDTDECAREDFLLPESHVSQFKNKPREIHSTKIYSHRDKNLVKIILSIIIKCYYSPCYPVSIFSVKRTYVRLTKTNWKWVQYKGKFLDKLNTNITLDVYPNSTVGFTVLKYFKGGNYSKVRLAISDEGNFVILKEFVEDIFDEVIDNELYCWIYGNQINNVYIETICNKKSLVMPLAFNIHKDDIKKKLYIPLDLKIWSVEKNVISDMLPDKLEILNNQLKEFTNDGFEYILRTAIEDFARSGCIHKDLEVRHFALYPVIENGNIIRLKPILIDFDHVEINKTYQEAFSYMNEVVNKIIKNYKNYSFEYVL